MTGIFPRAYDGGLPANPGTPNDPAQAYLHRHKLPIDTPALYFGNGCEVRLRPHVVNSLISEIASIADRAGVGYRASSLQNAETSIRYLIQRGLPHAAMLVEQNPWHFTFSLDPTPPCYTDFMTCTFVPRMTPGTKENRSFVRINMNGLGYLPLFRHDGSEMKSGDILALKPFMAAYFHGAWYLIGRIPPEFRIGGIDLWVRTDGNDATGDGTENSPDRAFRTIAAAFDSVATRFLATPLFNANIKLGIPGTYEAAYLGPFGSTLSITGGGADGGGWGGGSRWDYRIASQYMISEDLWLSLGFKGCNSVMLNAINMLIMNPASNAIALLAASGSSISMYRCGFDVLATNPRAYFMEGRSESTIGQIEDTPGGSLHLRGNGHTIGGAVLLSNSKFQTLIQPHAVLISENFNMAGAYLALRTLSSISFGGPGLNAWSNITGQQYTASTNSILYHNYSYASGPIPGTIPGTFDTGAQVVNA